MLGMSPLDSPAVMVRQAPKVYLTDLKESSSALTTYTFTSCNLGDFGGTASIADAYGTDPFVRAASRKFIVVFVHGEDAATAFSVNSVTIGGVSGTERVDRGGGSNAINSAIYTWTTDSLQGITNTDIAVTWSEAVTNCAIGVAVVENIKGFALTSGTLNSAVGTGEVAAGFVINSFTAVDFGMVSLNCSTLITGGSSEYGQFYVGGGTGQTVVFDQPTLLYEGSNANFAYAAAWAWSPMYLPVPGFSSVTTQILVSWSGTTNGDHVGAVFY